MIIAASALRRVGRRAVDGYHYPHAKELQRTRHAAMARRAMRSRRARTEARKSGRARVVAQ